MWVILAWAAILGGVALVATAGFYLPAALGTADIAPTPLAAVLATSVCGIVAIIVGWVLLKRRTRPR